MSRARYIEFSDGRKVWFDTSRNGEKFHETISDEMIELLSAVENIEIDDVLDANTSQGEAIERIRRALGQYYIPDSVIKHRDRLREERRKQPVCRICKEEGKSTQHHFVNKWMLKELSNYSQEWSDRRKNCIPLCMKCHRKVHSRGKNVNSIVGFLDDKEKLFAEKALTRLSEEHPKIMLLVARGEDTVYETRLIRDWIQGHFKS